MFIGILTAISVVSNVLAALGGIKGAQVTVAHLTPVVNAVGAVAGALATAQPITNVSSAVGDVGAALAALQGTGVIQGSDATLLNDAASAIAAYQAQAKNYISGQAAVLSSNFSYDGDIGYLIAITKGGPAAKDLGLA